MNAEEIIETLHRIRREVASNYEDLDLVESDRWEINRLLKDALILLGEEE